MTNLTPGDTYYVRAYATSGIGTGFGIPISFSTSANIPCGTPLSIPSGITGVYQLEFDTGTAVGATVIYFDPRDIPDGIRVLYDSTYYNALLGQTGGLKQGTAGNFTITGKSNNPCATNAIGTHSYTFYDGIVNNAWNNTGTTRAVVVASGDIQLGNNKQFSAIVIPKPLPGPSLITVEVLGPCSNTGWYLSFNCPVALPSFQGVSVGSGVTTCTAANTTYYFAQKYAGSLTYPEVNNWVFSDANGEFILPDGNYIMDNNHYITVVDGAVTATGNCT
jgi:hypothetical protein